MSCQKCVGALPAAGLSRRAVLNRFGLGLGGMALANLVNPTTLLGSPLTGPDRGVLGGSSTSPPRPSASSICSWPAGRRSSTCSTTSRCSTSATARSCRTRSARASGSPACRATRRRCRWRARSSSSPARQSGTWVSELLPHTAKIVDDLCFVRSMYTEAINHDPAITFFQTGSQIAGRPSMGAWLSYGLGSDNENLPAFVVLITPGKVDQPLYSRLWGSGFLPSQHQGVQFRSGKDPVLYLRNPDGVSRESRRLLLDRLEELHAHAAETLGDPEIDARIAQYEMAFRMQTSVPEVTDLSNETASTFDLYGPDARTPGTFAANCLLARRLAERGVRFIQLYHPGWDQHGNLPKSIPRQCAETDQACAALVTDLKQRGLLDDTLVVWGGEFGRTNYSQGKLTATDYGRDHHPRCFTMWMAGGGVKPGIIYGATDDFGYNVADATRPRPRLPRDAAAPAGHRSRAADVPLPGPPLPPHRRPRQGRGCAAGVNAPAHRRSRQRTAHHQH